MSLCRTRVDERQEASCIGHAWDLVEHDVCRARARIEHRDELEELVIRVRPPMITEAVQSPVRELRGGRAIDERVDDVDEIELRAECMDLCFRP
jgi:hypothetical protein